MEQKLRPWCDLPLELLRKINEFLDFPFLTLRLRAVCSRWRSSVFLPSFDRQFPRLILNLPFPFNPDSVLSSTSICLLLNPNLSSKGWLTAVRLTTTGLRQLLHPISGVQSRYSSIPLVSTPEIKFVELIEVYKLELVNPGRFPLFGVYRVIPFPRSATGSEVSFVATFYRGKLGYWKLGDPKLSILGDMNNLYDDIIEIRGQVYAVDRSGTVFWIDPSSLDLIQYSPLLIDAGGGSRKSLVESCGDLYVVDRYFTKERQYNLEDSHISYENKYPESRARSNSRENKPKSIGFRVYKLDEELGRWLNVKSLGDRIFVLNMDCSFSISASEFVAGKGNRIYFSDDDDRGLISDKVRVKVFLLEDGSVKKLKHFPEYSKIFLSPNIGLE